LEAADKHADVAARGPPRKIVVVLSQLRHMPVFQIHDAQPLTFRTEGSVDKPLSVRRVGGKAIVVDPGCDFAKTRTVRLHHRDLGALRAISEILAQSE